MTWKAGGETGAGRGSTSPQPEVQPKVSARTMERGWAEQLEGESAKPQEGLLRKCRSEVLWFSPLTQHHPHPSPLQGQGCVEGSGSSQFPECHRILSRFVVCPTRNQPTSWASVFRCLQWTQWTELRVGTDKRPGFQARTPRKLSPHLGCVPTRQPPTKDIVWSDRG